MKNSEWSVVIKPKAGLFELNLREVWRYRDLLMMFVKRDIVTVYKQTILGPLWYIIQPVLTTLMFTLVFGRMAGISTDGLPPIVFYLLGITIWNYFADCLNATSNTFIANQNIFGKVYFPRIISPASIVVSNLGKFFIQFGIFFCVFCYYWVQGAVVPNLYVLLLPLIVFTMGTTSLGFGMLFSSMTTKYRDLTFLLSFGVQLWMYATPVIYPLSSIPEKYAKYIALNPITHLVETMKFAFLGQGSFTTTGLLYSFCFGVVIFLLGLLVFNKVEKNFMDTV